MTQSAGSLTLIGAGELMPAMGKIHREALAQVQGPVEAVFIDTTAGFETNADAITEKAVEYYRHRLQTGLRVATYRHGKNASMGDVARAVAQVRSANYIFAGPGSPTYALEHWRGSPVWDAIVEQFHQGAHLLFASAASITLGCYSLPVYEIYKAGRDPYWERGLDILGDCDIRMAVVPHFNDNSGGENYDSRFCYMGAVRFDTLQDQLPPDVSIIGIDEYTSLRFEPTTRTATVSGQGGVTILANGKKTVHDAGAVLSFDDLHSTTRGVVQTAADEPRHYGYGFAEAGDEGGAFNELEDFVAGLNELNSDVRLDLLARIETAHNSNGKSEDPAPLLDLVLELRQALRTAKRWDLADRARDVLLELGYEVQDAPEGSAWVRR